MTDPPARRLVAALAVAHALLFAVLGLARWATFHHETFDLAFYTRMAWGLARVDLWEPIVNGHVFGLHLSPVLVPLGLLGSVLGGAPVLIVAQAAALSAAAFPLASIGARHLGAAGAAMGALVWLLHPNLAHVAGYEAHPGAIAALPLAWLAWAIDRGHVRALALATAGALACREDLALVTALAALLFGLRHRTLRRPAAIAGIASLAYAALFFLVLHPRHAPPEGSLELHFGRFGSSPAEVAAHLLTHPIELVRHVATADRLLYAPLVLAPFALAPLLRPAWLLPALPPLAINLLSDWPTARDLDVHYLTPALPFVAAGALEGGARLRRFAPLLVLAALAAHLVAGGTPLSLAFDGAAFRPDENTEAARAIVRAIPRDASVQAPDPLLAHLAERSLVRRTASPEAGTDYLVLDVAHRRRFAARESLLRTLEEPRVRTWLSRDDHRIVLAAGDYLLLERGRRPREGLAARAITGAADPGDGTRIAACLAVLGARRRGVVLELELVALGPCPNDLALRLGAGARPRRVDLLFGGWLNPVHLRRGDRLRSRHRLAPEEIDAIVRDGLRIGALRSSGARPERSDPISVPVALRTG